MGWIMSNLIDLEFKAHNIATSPFYEYQSVPDTESKGKWMVKMSPLNGSKSDEPARGFATKKDAQDFVNNTHYPHTMQPYVKPMPTWIDVNERLPERKELLTDKDKCLVLTECGKVWTGFYNMHIKPDDWYLHGWTEKQGWHPFKIVAWMPIPEFSTMQNLHKTIV